MAIRTPSRPPGKSFSATKTATPVIAREPDLPGTALYRQLKDYIAKGIQNGQWSVGDRLPSEHELVAQFGVSRMTVNRALRELTTEGRIVRVVGVGSFVAEDKAQSTLLRIANIADDIRARGHAYGCKVVGVERQAAPVDVANALDVRVGEMVFHVVCVHSENGLPVQLEDRFVNPRSAPEFMRQDFSTQSPSEYLVRHVPFDQVEHVVDAVIPTKEQAELLKMARSQPCLLLTRRTWNNGMTVTLVRCLHPASRYRLGSRFHLSESPGLA
jgi:GntR family transcriptional regulator, histidine utilization repressor